MSLCDRKCVTYTRIKLEKGMNCLITKGVNAGKIGKVDEIKEGTFSIPKSWGEFESNDALDW